MPRSARGPYATSSRHCVCGAARRPKCELLRQPRSTTHVTLPCTNSTPSGRSGSFKSTTSTRAPCLTNWSTVARPLGGGWQVHNERHLHSTSATCDLEGGQVGKMVALTIAILLARRPTADIVRGEVAMPLLDQIPDAPTCSHRPGFYTTPQTAPQCIRVALIAIAPTESYPKPTLRRATTWPSAIKVM